MARPERKTKVKTHWPEYADQLAVLRDELLANKKHACLGKTIDWCLQGVQKSRDAGRIDDALTWASLAGYVHAWAVLQPDREYSDVRAEQPLKASRAKQRQTAEFYARVNSYVANLREQCPRVSLTENRRRAAKEFGISYKTVLRAQKASREKK